MSSAAECGLCLRFAILAMLVWKMLTKPKTWSLGLGLLFVVGAMVAPVQLYLHSQHYSMPLIFVAGIAVTRTTIIWLFCVAPVTCATCCFVLRKDLVQKEPNPPLGPTPGNALPSGDTPQSGAAHL
jgi:hypothetical protein